MNDRRLTLELGDNDPAIVLPDVDPQKVAPALGSLGRPAEPVRTSGSTGHPKGAMQSHLAVLLTCQLTALMHGRYSGDTEVKDETARSYVVPVRKRPSPGRT